MIESMACGTTCVVNGDYWGFAEAELRPQCARQHLLQARLGRRPRGSRAARGVRIDASQWARGYTVREMRGTISRYIDERV